MDGFEELDNEKGIRFVKEGARIILACAAIFTLELVVYEAKGWDRGWFWWLGTFSGAGAWLIAPYAGIELLLNRKRLSLRQEIIHLVGAAAIIFFGLLILLDAFFLHFSPNNTMLYLLVPIYQWIGIIGTWGLSCAAGKIVR